MIIELDLTPAQVGITLDALADYSIRAVHEAEGEQLATVPSRIVEALALAAQDTARVVTDQLAPYADAIPAVARAYEPRHSTFAPMTRCVS